jgi:two-component system OmpR family sensor kinase
VPRGFSLRSLLLAGVTAVAVVLVAVGWSITAITRSYLTDQLDRRLVGVAEFDGERPPPPLEPGPTDPDQAERLSPFFEAILRADDSVVVIFEPNVPGQSVEGPTIDPDQIRSEPTGQPFTVEGSGGVASYRLVATELGDGFGFDGDLRLRGLALDEIDDTMERLILLEALGVAAVMAVLAAFAWAVSRLGIRPLETMTRTATDVSAGESGDLSLRVDQSYGSHTEAGALARAFNSMLARIESAVQAKTESEDRLRRFVADASHEFRTPLTTIQGYAELYRAGGLRDEAELGRAMAQSEHESKRLSRLVEDMLTLAQLDQERELGREPVDLAPLLADATANLAVTAPEHELSIDCEPDLWVVGDEDRLRQAVINLLANAVAHTPAGTTVQVRGRRRHHEVLIDVIDDGPGIEAEHLDRLTERFFRPDRSRSRDQHRADRGGGSGLGLAIVDAIMTAHDGQLTIASEPGIGTTAQLRLPTAS